MSKRVYVWKDQKPEEDEIFSGKLIEMSAGDVKRGEGSYEAGYLDLGVAKDGALILSSDSDSGIIYLYPQELKYLQRALTVAKKQAAQRAKGK